MKMMTIFFLMLVVSTASFSQQTIVAAPVMQNDYLKKSKNQKTTAWIMLGSGAVLVTGAILWGYSSALSSAWAAPENDDVNSGPDILSVVGSASMIGSIPFFIASGKNKKKARAASVFIDFKKIPTIQQDRMRSQSIPVLGLKVSL
jgi:hypothetical protein